MNEPRTAADGLTPQNYRLLQEHVYRASGIVLDNDKGYLLESRLMPIVARRQFSGLNELCARLQDKREGPLCREVIEAITTNETSFFRDAPLWHAFKESILPELIAARGAVRRLRFWSAASSSGQEAFSIVMTLLEAGLGTWDIPVLGTDLSGQMVERAQAARYSLLEAGRGLPATMLVKYFVRDGLGWLIKPEIRRLVRFEQLDLRQPRQTVGPFDLVFCRNVLIYFDVRTKQQVLKDFRAALFHGGHLVLGSAETTLNIDDSFERRRIGAATFYRIP